MISNVFYSLIMLWVHLFGDPQMTNFWEHKGYRRVVGGYWAKWDMGSGIMHCTMWFPSPCDHYPTPPLANGEPIEIEDWTCHCGDLL